MKKMIVEEHIVIYFPELSKRTKSCWKYFDILQGHPVLV